MMTVAEHVAEAERLLAMTLNDAPEGAFHGADESDKAQLAAAQIHASLAVALAVLGDPLSGVRLVPLRGVAH